VFLNECARISGASRAAPEEVGPTRAKESEGDGDGGRISGKTKKKKEKKRKIPQKVRTECGGKA